MRTALRLHNIHIGAVCGVPTYLTANYVYGYLRELWQSIRLYYHHYNITRLWVPYLYLHRGIGRKPKTECKNIS